MRLNKRVITKEITFTRDHIGLQAVKASISQSEETLLNILDIQ